MSASLVGSEMCIRDRNQRRKRVRTSSVPNEVLNKYLQLLAPANGGGARAVSYTHLTLPTICSV
eukprot:9364319-Alexandrium_andersonii.AAC.1